MFRKSITGGVVTGWRPRNASHVYTYYIVSIIIIITCVLRCSNCYQYIFNKKRKSIYI